MAQYGTYSLLRRSEGDTPLHLVEDYVKRVSLDKEQPPPAVIAYDREYAEEAAVRVITEIEDKAAEFEVTGVPLVFMSQGGTSLLISLAAAGMVLNVSRFQKKSTGKIKNKKTTSEEVVTCLVLNFCFFSRMYCRRERKGNCFSVF